jgi:hypothetical protein
VLGVNNKKAAGLAILVRANLVQKIGLAEIDHPGQCADNLTVGTPDRHRHAKHRHVELFALHGPADRGFTLLERQGHGFNVHVIDADPPGRQRQLGQCCAVHAINDDPTIEQAHRDRTLGQQRLHGRLVGQHGSVDAGGHGGERTETLLHRMVHMRRQN